MITKQMGMKRGGRVSLHCINTLIPNSRSKVFNRLGTGPFEQLVAAKRFFGNLCWRGCDDLQFGMVGLQLIDVCRKYEYQEALPSYDASLWHFRWFVSHANVSHVTACWTQANRPFHLAANAD